MKNQICKSILILTFALIPAYSVNAQTAAPPSADEIQRTQLVNALERAQTEVKASRQYIDGLNDEIQIKEKRIAALNEKDALAQSAIEGLQSEIKNLRLAVSEAQAALEIRKNEVADLKKDLDKTRRKLHRARQLTKVLIIAAGILGAMTVLK